MRKFDYLILIILLSSSLVMSQSDSINVRIEVLTTGLSDTTAVFIAGLIGQALVIYCFFFTEIAYLNFNIIGCLTVVVVSSLIQFVLNARK